MNDLSEVFATADLAEMGVRDALAVLSQIVGVPLDGRVVDEMVRLARVEAANLCGAL